MFLRQCPASGLSIPCLCLAELGWQVSTTSGPSTAIVPGDANFYCPSPSLTWERLRTWPCVSSLFSHLSSGNPTSCPVAGLTCNKLPWHEMPLNSADSLFQKHEGPENDSHCWRSTDHLGWSWVATKAQGQWMDTHHCPEILVGTGKVLPMAEGRHGGRFTCNQCRWVPSHFI